MSERDFRSQRDAELAPGDAAFVEQVRALSAHPGLDAAERVAFQARLDARLEAGGRHAWRRPVAGVAAALGAVALLWLALPVEPPAGGGARAPAFADAMLSLTDEASSETPSALPADYAAIEGLFFDG